MAPRRSERVAAQTQSVQPTPQSQPHTTFHPFRRLPIEIRGMVWRLHAPGPRIITIREGEPYQVDQTSLNKRISLKLEPSTTSSQPQLLAHNPRNDSADFYYEVPVAKQTIPDLCHISQETRTVARKIWPLHWGKRCQQPIWMSWNDTLFFESIRAWELFTRTMGNTSTLGVHIRRSLKSEDGDEPSQLAIAYNEALDQQMLRNHGAVTRDRDFEDTLQQNLKYLAIGGTENIPPPLFSALKGFWRLDMLLIQKTNGWKYRTPREPFILLDVNEAVLVMEWRKGSADCDTWQDWFDDRENFEIQYKIPRIEYLAASTMKRRLALDHGFTASFKAVRRPVNVYHASFEARYTR